eukprot:TRINITY_DN50083_c0_g1_i3.p1 TRINITY_DN50083_c0_g1~~TRINITY_DN50083_c0_g1_i3.p1  ORF type:complete len:329 (-),score=61.63 TRINITY_DN50083_c0_g1_i3:82-1068(-)
MAALLFVGALWSEPTDLDSGKLPPGAKAETSEGEIEERIGWLELLVQNVPQLQIAVCSCWDGTAMADAFESLSNPNPNPCPHADPHPNGCSTTEDIASPYSLERSSLASRAAEVRGWLDSAAVVDYVVLDRDDLSEHFEPAHLLQCQALDEDSLAELVERFHSSPQLCQWVIRVGIGADHHSQEFADSLSAVANLDMSGDSNLVREHLAPLVLPQLQQVLSSNTNPKVVSKAASALGSMAMSSQVLSTIADDESTMSQMLQSLAQMLRDDRVYTQIDGALAVGPLLSACSDRQLASFLPMIAPRLQSLFCSSIPVSYTHLTLPTKRIV